MLTISIGTKITHVECNVLKISVHAQAALVCLISCAGIACLCTLHYLNIIVCVRQKTIYRCDYTIG